MIAVQGPNARAKVWDALPGSRELTEHLVPFSAVEMGTMFIARTGYTGEDGFEIMIPAKAAPFFWATLAEKGVKPIGLGARDTLRLEAGMNLYGQDMDESVNPLEAGLAWTVDLKSERDFIGKAALLANPPVRKLVGLVLLDRGVLRGHQQVQTAHGAGEITSGSFSPTLEKSIALARVPNEVQIGDTVQVEIRDKILACESSEVSVRQKRQGFNLIFLRTSTMSNPANLKYTLPTSGSKPNPTAPSASASPNMPRSCWVTWCSSRRQP